MDREERERLLPPSIAKMSKSERMAQAIAVRQRRLARVERQDPAREEMLREAAKFQGQTNHRRTRADEFMS